MLLSAVTILRADRFGLGLGAPEILVAALAFCAPVVDAGFDLLFKVHVAERRVANFVGLAVHVALRVRC